MIINYDTIKRIYGEPRPLWQPLSEAEKFHEEMEKLESKKRQHAAWIHRDRAITNIIFIGIPLFSLCYYYTLYFTFIDFSPLSVIGCAIEMQLVYLLLADGERI
jgi:hypothetical protein